MTPYSCPLAAGTQHRLGLCKSACSVNLDQVYAIRSDTNCSQSSLHTVSIQIYLLTMHKQLRVIPNNLNKCISSRVLEAFSNFFMYIIVTSRKGQILISAP